LRSRSIAIVTNKNAIYPPTHGAARRIWGLARALCHFGLRVHVIESAVDGMIRHRQIGEIRISSFPYPLPRTFRANIGAARAFGSISPSRRIIRSGPQFNPGHTAYLAKLRFRSMLDIVQIESPYPIFEGLPLRTLGAELILDQHGVEIDYLHEILASVGRRAIPFESVQVSILERLAIQAASSVLCCSDLDKRRMMRIYGGQETKFIVVENGIDEEFFSQVKPFIFPDPTVLFLGSFNHSPNLHAIDWIVHNVIPRVHRVIPETRFAFVGSGSLELPRVNNSLVFRNVNDVRPFIRGAQVGLATIFYGSGSRLKILEYSACGLPVVATTKGMEGLDLEPGSEILVANDADSVAGAIIDLVSNKPLATRIAINAMSKVRSRYVWRSIVFRALSAYSS